MCDDFDGLFDIDGDGELNGFEENEAMLYAFGDGIHESSLTSGGVDDGDDDDDDGFDIYGNSAVYDELGEPIDPDEVDLYDTVYDENGDPIDEDGGAVSFTVSIEFVEDSEDDEDENDEDEDDEDEDDDKDGEDENDAVETDLPAGGSLTDLETEKLRAELTEAERELAQIDEIIDKLEERRRSLM